MARAVKRAGKPVHARPRAIWLTDDEYEALRANAKRNGLSIGEWIGRWSISICSVYGEEERCSGCAGSGIIPGREEYTTIPCPECNRG